jgi:hypothetical protein
MDPDVWDAVYPVGAVSVQV